MGSTITSKEAKSNTYRVLVDLDGSTPPIWRRLDLRADLPLDVVHLVVQAAFDWENRHLYRFAMGGGPFDDRSLKVLCDEDIAEGEDRGLPASQTSLGAMMSEPGDRLGYVYDYGDLWELTLELEQVLTPMDSYPAAVVIDGERAAPPEDCGGITDAVQLATVLPDPELFDLARLNEALHGPFFSAVLAGLDSRLISLLSRLPDSPVLVNFVAGLVQLSSAPTIVDDDILRANLTAHQWFLDRAAKDAIPLTSAGYLKPSDVTAAAAVVPQVAEWMGKNNREANCPALLNFRESLQAMGLLRKLKGSLVLTKAGIAAQRDPAVLWRHLASRLIPSDGEAFECHATLLFLAQAGGAEDSGVRFKDIAEALTQLGWRREDGEPVPSDVLYRLTAHDVLVNVCDRPRRLADLNWISPAAAALARAALRAGRLT